MGNCDSVTERSRENDRTAALYMKCNIRNSPTQILEIFVYLGGNINESGTLKRDT